MANAGFRAPRPTRFRLPGASGYATIDMMLYDMELNHQISEYDRKIGKKLATVLTGGDTSPSVPVTQTRSPATGAAVDSDSTLISRSAPSSSQR